MIAKILSDIIINDIKINNDIKKKKHCKGREVIRQIKGKNHVITLTSLRLKRKKSSIGS